MSPLTSSLGFNCFSPRVFHRGTMKTVCLLVFLLWHGSYSRKPRDVENTYLTGKFTLFYHKILLAGFHPHCSFLTAIWPWQHSYRRARQWLCCPQRGDVCLLARAAVTRHLGTACLASPAETGGMRRVAMYPGHTRSVAQWEGTLANRGVFTIICLTPMKKHGVFLNDDRSWSVTHHFSPSGLALQRLQHRRDVVTAQVGEH